MTRSTQTHSRYVARHIEHARSVWQRGSFLRALTFVVLIILAWAIPVAPAAAPACPSNPANDCIQSAIEWFGKTETFSNVGATMEPGEPSACGTSSVQASVWFEVEVIAPGSTDALAIGIDAPFYATLGAYVRDAGGALTLLDCRTSWEDEGLHSPTVFVPCTPGARYWLQVGSMGAGARGAFQLREWTSFWRDRCWFAPTLPTEPQMYAPTGGNGEIIVSWVEPWWDGGRSVNLTHYNVYRANTCSGPWTLIGSPIHRSWRDTGLPAGATRCYQVTAVNPVGEGPAEPGRTATTWTTPRPPRSLAAAPAGNGELALSWLPSLDQNGPAAMVAHRVCRAAASEGPYTLVGTAGASATSFVDTGLGAGVTMHYRVSAVNVVGEGDTSAPAAGTTYRTPGTPRDVTVRQVFSLQPFGFEVSWVAPTDPAPFTHYRIYRASSPTGAAQLVGQVSSGTLKFVDNGRGAFIDYYYEVRASNPAGEGAASSRSCYVHPFETTFARCM